MPSLPAGYPARLSDAELAGAISDILARATVARLNFDDVLPEIQVTIIQAGFLEQTRRELVASSRIAKLSLVVASAALIIAVVAIVVG